MSDLPEISKAYELRPGAVYALQVQPGYHMREHGAKDLLEDLCRQTGCKFILIDAGLRLVEPPHEPEYEAAEDGTITVS